MGIDLQLMTSHFRERDTSMAVTTVIRLDRDDWLFDQIRSRAHTLPAEFWVGHGDQDLRDDAYGVRLTCLFGKDFASIQAATPPAIFMDPLNRAALQFFCMLPPETRVILYWC